MRTRTLELLKALLKIKPLSLPFDSPFKSLHFASTPQKSIPQPRLPPWQEASEVRFVLQNTTIDKSSTAPDQKEYQLTGLGHHFWATL
jgi:hypothetical protein